MASARTPEHFCPPKGDSGHGKNVTMITRGVDDSHSKPSVRSTRFHRRNSLKGDVLRTVRRKRYLKMYAIASAMLLFFSVFSNQSSAQAAAQGACGSGYVFIGARGTGQSAGANLAAGSRVWKAGGHGTLIAGIANKIKQDFKNTGSG